MRLKTFAVAFLLAVFTFTASAQTRIQPGQMVERPLPVAQPPETATFFAIEGQTVFILAPGTNREVMKVEVFRNGLLQSDVGNARVQADYTLSTDKRTITFQTLSRPTLDDIIRVLYWLK